jgi:hypothetical protein
MTDTSVSGFGGSVNAIRRYPGGWFGEPMEHC